MLQLTFKIINEVKFLNYLKKSKTFYILVIAISIGLLLSVYDDVSFVFYPLEVFFNSLFTPILIAGFIYYVFLPVYNLIKKKITSDKIALPLVFIIILTVVYFIVSTILPSLLNQISSFIGMIPSIVNTLITGAENILVEYDISTSEVYQYINDMNISLSSIVTGVLEGLSMGVTSVLSTTISTAITLFIVPFLLYYFFKEGEKFPEFIVKFIPEKYKELTNDLLGAFHFNASQYIGGRVLVCIYVAVASYIIYTVLGVPNALLLGIVTGIFDIIPYFGPFIGAAPAFLIALSISPMTALLLIISITIVQFGESYLVTPLVMGKSLDMHPITVVLLVLFANELFGILGMILILPIYSILKACAIVIYQFFSKNHKKKQIDM